MTTELENELEIIVSESCKECRTFGYPPTIFEDMIRKYGAVKAIKKLINKTEPTAGFDKLKNEGRLDLSAEALILENKNIYKLFTDHELKISRERLIEHGYTLAKVCPECGHVFQGKGWTGIDAHWRANHEDIMPYEEAWALIKIEKYESKNTQ